MDNYGSYNDLSGEASYEPVSDTETSSYAGSVDPETSSDPTSDEVSEKNPKYTPILPFNDLAIDHYIIYDNVTYRRDLAITEFGQVMHNPNMIKYYTTTDTEPLKLGGD